jgi:hypothetical protein
VAEGADETPAPEKEEAADGGAAKQAEIGDFIEKEKAEVYLLMDFLSGRADTTLRDEKISILVNGSAFGQAAGAAVVLAARQVAEVPLIDAVCNVRWPPGGADSKQNIADTAAILLKARDRLCEIASPASGASIAFTTFVTNEMARTLRKKVLDRLTPAERRVTPENADQGRQRVILLNSQIAYPDYQDLAGNFNLRRQVVGVALPVMLALTVFASFLVTYYPDMYEACVSSGGDCKNFTWLTFVKTFESHGLPVMYGLVGALAGVLRSVQVKIRDGLLMPRDRLYLFMQLWLGIVMGATIGLFNLSPTAGAVTAMTPSALAFIAGLGVDSVFLWLESLIKTIFGAKQ